MSQSYLPYSPSDTESGISGWQIKLKDVANLVSWLCPLYQPTYPSILPNLSPLQLLCPSLFVRCSFPLEHPLCYLSFSSSTQPFYEIALQWNSSSPSEAFPWVPLPASSISPVSRTHSPWSLCFRHNYSEVEGFLEVYSISHARLWVPKGQGLSLIFLRVPVT